MRRPNDRTRKSLQCLLILAFLTLVDLASAYPQFVGRGEFNCRDCHYSPTGGGLVNSWGRQSREVSLSPQSWLGGESDDWWGHADATGRAANERPVPEIDLGGDLRLLNVPPGSRVIPMLVEAGTVAAYGDVLGYATVTLRKGSPSTPYIAASREHWLSFGINDELTVRAGRLVLPFGLRMADHTQYVRERFGFDKYDQSYALELDWVRDDASISAAGFVGDLLRRDSNLRESGGVGRATVVIAESLELGLSILGAESQARRRVAGSASARWNPFPNTYLLGEFTVQRLGGKRVTATEVTRGTFVRLGYFLFPSLDLHIELGQLFLGSEGSDYTLLIPPESEAAESFEAAEVRPLPPRFRQSRVGVGANWQVGHWLELIPQAILERYDDASPRLAGLLQVHLTY